MTRFEIIVKEDGVSKVSLYYLQFTVNLYLADLFNS